MEKVREYLRTAVASLGTGTVKLYHGTDVKSIKSLMDKGISGKMLARISGGAETFWVCGEASLMDAWQFAEVNPRGSDRFGVIEFEVPEGEFRAQMKAGNIVRDDVNWAPMEVYEIKPAAFGLLSKSPMRHMTLKPPKPAVPAPQKEVAAWKEDGMRKLALLFASRDASGIRTAMADAMRGVFRKQAWADVVKADLGLSSGRAVAVLEVDDSNPEWRAMAVLLGARLRGAGYENELKNMSPDIAPPQSA